MQGNKVAHTRKSFQLLKGFWQSIFKGRFAGRGGGAGGSGRGYVLIVIKQFLHLVEGWREADSRLQNNSGNLYEILLSILSRYFEEELIWGKASESCWCWVRDLPFQ